MDFFRRLKLVFISSLLLTACGGGGSSSGSGIGGTGITLVQGNVSSVNGQLFVSITPFESRSTLNILTEWIIPLSYAQTGLDSLIVSGGGQSTKVDASGAFALPNVTPSSNFVLNFRTGRSSNIPLSIGKVLKGTIVTVKNIALDTNKKSAEPDEIDVKEPDEIKDNKDDGKQSESSDSGESPDASEDSGSSPEGENSSSPEDPPEAEDPPKVEDPPDVEDPPEVEEPEQDDN